MTAPFAIRKIDTEDPHWYVVDLRIPGAAILAGDAVVDRCLSRDAAHRHANELNAVLGH